MGMPLPSYPYPHGLSALCEVNYPILLAKATYKPLLSSAATPESAVHSTVRYPLHETLSLSHTEAASLSPSTLNSLLLRECAEADGEAESDFELLLAMKSVSGFEEASIEGWQLEARLDQEGVKVGESIAGKATIVDYRDPPQSELTIRAGERARSTRAKVANGMMVMGLVSSVANVGNTKCTGWDGSQVETEAVDAEWLLPLCLSREHIDKIARSA
eukprot:CAMPEP_0169432620 /NCGR_PEP_ID=MMETSP1042-20121227/3585_1 /TAXON_ID=464988 /ORGANISM="Hemiselmis andersenii, Strain CCMP1180" /LENGTH=216 /DNA_ID=CAMNT_0009543125 /DNA_START=33 /DNA_END=683 /DNA_ORIENTATION=-